MSLKGLPRLLITVPLLALPLAAGAANLAHAGSNAAEEAVRILSKAHAASQRCSYLSGSEASELSRYKSRAEIAAVSQKGAKAARAAAAAGTAAGNGATCSPDLEADVKETLQAAREAVAATGSDPEPASPPPRKAQAKAADGRKDAMSRKGKGSLDRYERVVRAYYLERECRSLSKSEAGRFWTGMVSLHKAAVSANGASAVAPVMRGAERRARGSSCGSGAMAEIRRGYSEIVSR